MWENHEEDVLNVRKINKRCAKYWKIYERVVVKVIKFCKRCAQSEKIFKEMYCMWENYERCTEWEKFMQEMR